MLQFSVEENKQQGEKKIPVLKQNTKKLKAFYTTKTYFVCPITRADIKTSLMFKYAFIHIWSSVHYHNDV